MVRFRRKFSVGTKAECWLWNGTIDAGGYGVFSVGHSTKFRAHRIAWALENGDPGELHVCHRCDNPMCVNPSHMFLGTMRDNQADKVAKGRQAKGERIAGSRLTEREVADIRASYDQGTSTQRELARRHGVSVGTINYVVNRKGWNHV